MYTGTWDKGSPSGKGVEILTEMKGGVTKTQLYSGI